MKIYTKKGDEGRTSIIGASNIYKDDIRIEAYGTIDELNSYIGLLRSCHSNDFSYYKKELVFIQNCLFNIGTTLASKKKSTHPIVRQDVDELEKFIDTIDTHLNPLTSFILPGGDVWSSYAQVSRAICRRAERRIISLSIQEKIDPMVLIFVNRLSDYFFVLARRIAQINNVEEIKWET